MAFADWSSLPFDLINRIADCFLPTNDVDYYMDFRAVCRSWRSATDDPTDTPDPRFHPRRWVNIDAVSRGNTRLLVNTATGRFLRKELPLLHNYCVIAITTDGLLLLMDSAMDSPVSVLNPLTGYLIRFMVPLPDIKTLDIATLVSGSSPTLLLLCHSSRQIYRADLDSECYDVYEDNFCTCPLIWLAVRGIYGNGDLGSVEPFPPAVAGKMCSLLMMFNVDPPELSDDDEDTLMSEDEAIWKFWIGYENRGFLLKSGAGELLIIIKLDYHMKVFKMDTDRNVLEAVKTIGNRAIFLGDCCRCMSVDDDKFPSVEANCIYYTKRLDFTSEIHAYDIMKKKVERISKDFFSDSPPYTITQLLCNCILE